MSKMGWKIQSFKVKRLKNYEAKSITYMDTEISMHDNRVGSRQKGSQLEQFQWSG